MSLVALGLVGAGSGGAALAQPSSASSSTGASAVSSFSRDHLDQWWYDAMGLGAVQKKWTGKGVKIAVVDGAVNPRVPDLRGADIHLRRDCYGKKVLARDEQTADHGTEMLEFLVGQGRGTGPGGRGILGIAPGATVDYWSMTMRGFDGLTCDGVDGSPLLVKAARAGADIISISVGDGYQDSWNEAVKKAQELGAVVVAASGAADSVGGFVYPARSPGVVATYAVDRKARSWSNNPPQDPGASKRQAMLNDAFATTAAPGVDTQIGGYTDGRYTSTGTSTGTSNAAPLVAGALALVKQKYPQATNNQLIQNLIHNPGGSKAGRTFGYEPRFGFGIVNVGNMLADDATKWPDVNPLLVADPAKTEKLYPDSVYGKTVQQLRAASQGGEKKAEQASGTKGAGQDQQAVRGSGGGGVSWWVWLVAAVVVVAGAAAALVIRRSGSRT